MYDDINIVAITGRVVRDIDLRELNDARRTRCVHFTLAVNKYMGKEKGIVPTFIDCAAYSRLAEIISTYIRKGDEMGVKGYLQFKTTDNPNYPDGKKKIARVIAEKINFGNRALANKNVSYTSSNGIESATPPPELDYGDYIPEDDMPF